MVWLVQSTRENCPQHRSSGWLRLQTSLAPPWHNPISLSLFLALYRLQQTCQPKDKFPCIPLPACPYHQPTHCQTFLGPPGSLSVLRTHTWPRQAVDKWRLLCLTMLSMLARKLEYVGLHACLSSTALYQPHVVLFALPHQVSKVSASRCTNIRHQWSTVSHKGTDRKLANERKSTYRW